MTADTRQPRRRMPAEWEPHRATWIAWPHHEPDWPGKLAPIPWVYAEIARVLADFEPVEILCHSEPVYENAGAILESHGGARGPHPPAPGAHRSHLAARQRADRRRRSVGRGHAAQLGVQRAGRSTPTGALDAQVGRAIADIAQLPRVEPTRPDNGAPMVLEGGGIEVNGAGLLLVTEEWLLSDVQVRNPGLTREGYERGVRASGSARARRSGSAKAAPATTRTGTSTTSRGSSRPTRSCSRSKRIRPTTTTRARWTTSGGWSSPRAIRRSGRCKIVRLPYPRRVMMNGERLPASYANFYIANGVVLVPTFNDPNDRVALNVLAELMPRHQIVGIHAVDLVWGLGHAALPDAAGAARRRRSGVRIRRGGR